jgi:hypothetical protein
MPSWLDQNAAIAPLAQLQLFFVGGAPRSGTTWLQQMVDCHPHISCRGEGLFWKHLAVPLDAMMAERRQALDEKNTKLFRHTGGYPPPPPDHADAMIGTAILLALHEQAEGKPCLAMGEKTPRMYFSFPGSNRFSQARS